MNGQIHRAAARRFAPWKNGGGETAEIIRHPACAGFETFDWRISTARVDQSGPFSVFPGIERVLTVLEGGPMELHFGDGREIVAGPQTGPHSFSGGMPCEARLKGPGLLNLNLMVRAPMRGRMLTPGARLYGQEILACYLFATQDLPDLDLHRHDLMERPPVNQDVPDGALLLAILSVR